MTGRRFERMKLGLIMVCLAVSVIADDCEEPVTTKPPMQTTPFSYDPLMKDHEETIATIDSMLKFAGVPDTAWGTYKEKLLKAMDTNSDSYVSDREREKWLIESHRRLNRKKNHKQFEFYDADDNGFVSFSEYFNHDCSEHENSYIFKDTQRTGEVELFFESDVIPDFNLNEEEFDALLYPFAYPHMTPGIIEQLMFYDQNKDRKITYREICSMSDKKYTNMRMIGLHKMFVESDEDGSGDLEGKEIYKWQLLTFLSNLPVGELNLSWHRKLDYHDQWGTLMSKSHDNKKDVSYELDAME